MIIVLSILVAVVLVALKSTTDALGVWLLLMITHIFIINQIGDIATHLPLFAGVLVLLMLLLKKEITSINIKVLSFFLVLIALMMISGFAGLDVETSLVQIMAYAKGMFLALIISTVIKDVGQINRLSSYCLVALAFGACVALYQQITGQFTIDSNEIQRATGVSSDPNESAMMSCVGLSISLYWIYRSQSRFLTLSLIVLIFMLMAGVAMSGSRGGALTLLVISILLFLKKPSTILAVGGLVLVIGAAALAPQSTWDRLSSLVTGEETHGQRSLYSRTALVKDGIEISLKNPLVGVGPGNFARARSALQAERSQVTTARSSRQETFGPVAHNMYLEFFAENGFIAGGLFLYILLASMRNLLRLDRYLVDLNSSREIGIGFTMAVAIFAMLLASLFLSEGKNSVLWFLIGVGLSSTQVIRNRLKEERAGNQVLKHQSA